MLVCVCVRASTSASEIESYENKVVMREKTKNQ